jgi:hypothetical protein
LIAELVVKRKKGGKKKEKYKQVSKCTQRLTILARRQIVVFDLCQ